MDKYNNFYANLIKALRFYEVGIYALSLKETSQHVLHQLIKPFKPKTSPELFAAAQSQSANAMKNIQDCYHYLANSTNAIVLSHLEVLIDEILNDIYLSSPFIADNPHHKGKSIEKGIEDEMYFFHGKNYKQKINYLKKNFNIDIYSHKSLIEDINKRRNGFLHKGVVYAFTKSNIVKIVTEVLRTGEDLVKQAEAYGE